MLNQMAYYSKSAPSKLQNHKTSSSCKLQTAETDPFIKLMGIETYRHSTQANIDFELALTFCLNMPATLCDYKHVQECPSS